MWCRIRVGRVWVWVGAAAAGRGGTGSGEAGNLWARSAEAIPQECIHAVFTVTEYKFKRLAWLRMERELEITRSARASGRVDVDPSGPIR
jgi:hypothetical protein